MIKGFEPHEAITAVLNWSKQEENDWFDTSFVDSLSEALDEYDGLTEGQSSALENIITKMGIDISEHA